jgi:putative hydrolase of the HAD superfamily
MGKNNRQVNRLNSHSAVFLPIRAVLFDIGGVFFPWPQSAFFMQWETRLAIAPGHIHQLLWHGPDIEAANIGAITAEEYCCRCAGRLGVDEVQARALIETAFSGEHLNDELATYVWLLHSRVHTAALTNTWSFGRRLIERRGITDLFDLIVTSAEEGVKKPQARIYEITLERLDVIAAEAVFIDDTDENVMAARDLGMQSILFHSTEQTIAELEALLAQRGVVHT